ncbi:unnamed protein product, partial [Staurois parvus]
MTAWSEHAEAHSAQKSPTSLRRHHTKTFWTLSCSQLCGHSLGMAP